MQSLDEQDQQLLKYL